MVLNNGGPKKSGKIPKIVATLICSAGARNKLGSKLETDWSFKLSGWSIWWLRQEREAYKAGKISSEKEQSRRMEATRVEAQAAKSTFIKNMGKQHQPQQVKYQMEGNLEASSFLEVMEMEI